MFLQEEIIADKRPTMAVIAPGNEFVLKYFDREFDCRLVFDPDGADVTNIAVVVLSCLDKTEIQAEKEFREKCMARNIPTVTLRVPFIIGTGMGEEMMRLARGVARGTLMTIKENEARISLIHASDIPKVAKTVAGAGPADFTVAASPVLINDLISGLGHRIKNKRVGSISRKWARLLYGKDFFTFLTTDHIIDTTTFNSTFPDFRFADPAEYLKTHNYDHDSL